MVDEEAEDRGNLDEVSFTGGTAEELGGLEVEQEPERDVGDKTVSKRGARIGFHNDAQVNFIDNIGDCLLLCFCSL